MAPDFEDPSDDNVDNDYEVQVTVTDSGSFTGLQDITVSVTNLNDNPPEITSNGGGATAVTSAAENQTAVTDVDAIDVDGGAENGSGLTYARTTVAGGGSDNGAFTVDEDTGVLTFTVAPDFEAPADDDTDNVYEVQVTVTDSGGLTDVQDITVTVTDVNEVPTITSDAAVDAAENQTAVIDVDSTDLDGETENGGGLVYSLTTAAAGGVDNVSFLLNTATGVLTFAAAPDFDVAGDDDTDNVYEVQVTVTDGGGLTDVQDLAVTVTDVNEVPTITSDGGGATAAVNAAENQTAVSTVVATDEDVPAQTLLYSITGGDDQALFGIVASTGVLTFDTAPNFEIPGDDDTDNAYEVQVTVTDSGSLTDVQDLTVTVTDVNDAPTITSDGGGATAELDAAENQTAVTTVTATDADLPAQTLLYSITDGDDQALFEIVGSTGVLTFVAAPDFETPLDVGGDNVYDVQVTVTDDGAGTSTDVQDLAVTVADANDAPMIVSAGTASVGENQTAALDVGTLDDSDSEGS